MKTIIYFVYISTLPPGMHNHEFRLFAENQLKESCITVHGNRKYR